MSSRITRLKSILAQQAPVPAAPVGQVAPAPAAANVAPAANAQAAPTTPAPAQYSNIDFNAAITMIPQIMKQINSTQIGAVRDYMIKNLKADPNVVQQATTSYAVKIYKEESAKRQQQLIMEVGKKLGIDPSQISGNSQTSPLPPLPGMQAAMKRRIRLASLIKSDLYKKADVNSVVESVDHLSTVDKIHNLYQFFSNFDSISDGVKNIMDFISNFNSNFPNPPSAPVTAQMSKHIGTAAAILWVISFIIMLGAAGTSDFNAKYYTHISNADKLKEAQAMMLALKSVGAASITTAIANFFKKREEKEKRPINK